MRLSWINQVGPKCHLKVLISKKEAEVDQIHGGKGDVKTEQRFGHKPRNHKSQEPERGKEQISPQSIHKDCSPANTSIQDFWPPKE